MSNSVDHALVFGARKLAECLLSRHSLRVDTARIIKWAKDCAGQHGPMSKKPDWWIGAAIADVECLDACYEMLRNS